MNREIEEMKTVINCAVFSDFKNGHGVCIKTISEHLYNAGYRKSTDVAREIFEEIVKFIFSEIPNELMPLYKRERDFTDGVIFGKREAFFEMLNHLDRELRKKYESEGEE